MKRGYLGTFVLSAGLAITLSSCAVAAPGDGASAYLYDPPVYGSFEFFDGPGGFERHDEWRHEHHEEGRETHGGFDRHEHAGFGHHAGFAHHAGGGVHAGGHGGGHGR